MSPASLAFLAVLAASSFGLSLAQAAPKQGTGGPPDPKPGKVTGVTVTPTQPNVGAQVKFIIGTSGACQAFSVNFGDGSAPATVDLGALPTGKILTHVYAKAGSATVAVKGVGDCTGSATAHVTVKGSGTPTDAALNQMIDGIYVDPQFGNKSIRGFIIKEINGKVIAGMNTGLSFQPLSTLKLLPYLYTMVEIDKGNATLATNLTWIEATVDDPATKNFDDTKFGSCYAPGAPNTKQNSAPYSVALPTMMWFSHNRTLDAVLAKYGPANITNRGHQLGLANTQMFYGCPQGGDMQPWAKNRSTLLDLAKLYEGVDSKTFVKKDTTRQAFYDNMINITYSGSSYNSPILGPSNTLTLGIYDLNTIVKREAMKLGLPDTVVDQFLQQVVVRGKGGSGGPSGSEMGFSDFLHVTLPFKAFQSPIAEFRAAKKTGPNTGPPLPKVIVPKSFSIGWFIYNLTTPAGCPDPNAAGADKATCDAIWHQERLAKFRSEIFAPAIREALATW